MSRCRDGICESVDVGLSSVIDTREAYGVVDDIENNIEKFVYLDRVDYELVNLPMLQTICLSNCHCCMRLRRWGFENDRRWNKSRPDHFGCDDAAYVWLWSVRRYAKKPAPDPSANHYRRSVEGFECRCERLHDQTVLKTGIAGAYSHMTLSQINNAYARFVPREFLNQLGQESILDVPWRRDHKEAGNDVRRHSFIHGAF